MTSQTPESRLREAGTGRRAVVRYRIPGGLTDALGIITALDPESCTVETRSGPVTIPWHLVTAGKPVPDPPARRARPGGGMLA
ncbi:ferrous iron transport protein A [Arthrobacter sp. 7Tela_A1]|uniref:putative acetyltransferase n=1 Tax=Arthrobacter sp. 7Tela_A1 TaxID=3093745 RepID=UPI003BB66E7E